MPEIQIEIHQIGQTTASEALIRNHRVLVDRPQAKGGTDQGAMGGELLLAALGGCFMSNLIAACKARELPTEGLAVRVRGTLDGSPPSFQRMVVEVRAAGLEREQLVKLALVAERGCIVAKTLKGSVDLEVRVG